MQWKDVADRAGINQNDLDSLLQGRAFYTVEQKLGVPSGLIDDYINRNDASALLANRLGFHAGAAETLGRALGREGRIGLLLGLLIG